MKKFFLFAAAVVAAMTVKAAEWDFSVDTINVVEAVEAYATGTTFKLTQKESSEKSPYVAVDYDLANKEEAVLDFATSPVKIKFTFANSSSKTECLKLYNTYLQINRKGVKMAISCNVGDVITFYPKSYSKACEFAVTGANEGTIAIEANSEDAVSVTATASEVLFDTSSPSSSDYAQACQLLKIAVGATQGINNTNAAVKAEKFFRDGQLIIRKNGVEYNAIGTQF
jgi:hypothetical protein